MEKIGTVTVSVYKSIDKKQKNTNKDNKNSNRIATEFTIQVDNEDVIPISEIIEDRLRLY